MKLNFSDDALDYIVDTAIEYKLGARGLRSIVEIVMKDAMFETPSKNTKQLTVDKKYVESQLAKANLNVLSRQNE